MIGREEARLRSLFQRLLVVSAALAPAACSSAGASAGDATDASLGPDATQPTPAGDDASAGVDAPDAPDAKDDLDASTSDVATDAPEAADALDPFGFLDAACDPQFLADRDGGDCDFFEYLPCGLPPGSPSEGCALLVAQCGTLCEHVPTENRRCAVSECLAVDASTVPEAGPVTLDCATGAPQCGPGIGRRPRGLVARRPLRARDAVGRALAEMAHLEAASVHAFRRLAADLASLGAPPELVRAARRSARDEVRHARVTARLARRRGAAPAAVAIGPVARARTLLDVALENAVEGCVRESFGALVATRQAARARDPEIAAAMVGVAADETRHAALSWALARWIAPRLAPEDRARVDAAMQDAIASMKGEIAALRRDVAAELGLPEGAEAAALIEGFAAAVAGEPLVA